jgi:uncharacterized protein
MSSVHITFNTEEEWRSALAMGWMGRIDVQFHWDNNGYTTFDAFLGALKQSKRKSIRQERKSITKQGLTVHRLQGTQISDSIWDQFFDFYTNTTGVPESVTHHLLCTLIGRASSAEILGVHCLSRCPMLRSTV